MMIRSVVSAMTLLFSRNAPAKLRRHWCRRCHDGTGDMLEGLDLLESLGWTGRGKQPNFGCSIDFFSTV
jgi:hypothetical protein